MKVIISENRVNRIIRKYLDETFTPDYGWGNNTRHGSYQDDVDRYGELVFFINDTDSYKKNIIYNNISYVINVKNIKKSDLNIHNLFLTYLVK